MKNFKEIAEKCFAGELSGTFVLRCNRLLHSKCLIKMKGCLCPYYIDGYYYSDNGNCYNRHLRLQNNDIINFIPDNGMQEQIKIDIPEGKVPVMEQTESGITITWANKDITYKQVFDYLNENHQLIQYQANMMVNKNDSDFLRKVNVIGKLTNIRNYFGKLDSHNRGYCIDYDSYGNKFYVGNINTIGIWTKDVVFAKKEHAEQAIKMLGGELKYLFEPW